MREEMTVQYIIENNKMMLQVREINNENRKEISKLYKTDGSQIGVRYVRDDKSEITRSSMYMKYIMQFQEKPLVRKWGEGWFCVMKFWFGAEYEIII